MVKAKQNELVRHHYTVFDASDQPLTGQNGSVVLRLQHNGAIAAETPATVEIGTSGLYVASFTPLSLGDYRLEVDKTGIATDTRIEAQSYDVEAADLDDIKGDTAAIKTQTDIFTFSGSNVQARVNDKGVLNDPTVGQIADQVWEELIADHIATAGSAAQAFLIAHGVPQRNIIIDNYNYDGPNLTGCRIRVFKDNTKAVTLLTLNLTATFTGPGGRQDFFEVLDA